jgi:dTMP kinase
VFVTFEGIEGSGKSSHLARLAAALRERGRTVTATREPGGTSIGVHIRRILTDPTAPSPSTMAELLLYLADRAQHVREVIRPALEAGHIVLCDRFSDSTLAYQGHARGGDLTMIRQLDAIAREGSTPDLTFLLSCPVGVGLDRTRSRKKGPIREDRFELEPLAFHERVQAGLLEIARAEPERFVVLDTLRPPEEVQEEILSESLRRLSALEPS